MIGNSDRYRHSGTISANLCSASFRLPHNLWGTTLQEFIKLYNNLSEIEGNLGATMRLICWTAAQDEFSD